MPYNPVQSTRRSSRVVDVASNTTVMLAAYSPNRNILELMNIDVGLVTLGFGVEPTFGSGPALAAASAAGGQGGVWSSNWVPEQGPVYARTGNTATRIAVVEG